MLIAISIVDFAQPQGLWQKWDDTQREAFVNNVAKSLGTVTNSNITVRQRTFTGGFVAYILLVLVFNTVSAYLASRIATAIGTTYQPVTPLNAIKDLIANLTALGGPFVPPSLLMKL